MNILFITASRIGDAVLSAGLLEYIVQTHPDARVTIACGPLAASLFEGYPLLERIIPLKKQKHNKHWITLWQAVIGTRWDMVIDLRNSAVSRLIFAKKRHIFGHHIDKQQHKVEQNAALMGLPDIPSPKLWFTAEQRAFARSVIPQDTPVIAVGPTANWRAKTWPKENFTHVLRWMIGEQAPMSGAHVAVIAAPGEEEDAYAVLHALPESRRIDLIAKTDPGTAAAALSLCNFYLGNDSGLMHCAAATGIPTLGLFGPSYPALYRPWGENAAYVSTPETFDELIDYEGYTAKSAPCLMTSLSVEMVIDKIKTLAPKA